MACECVLLSLRQCVLRSPGPVRAQPLRHVCRAEHPAGHARSDEAGLFWGFFFFVTHWLTTEVNTRAALRDRGFLSFPTIKGVSPARVCACVCGSCHVLGNYEKEHKSYFKMFMVLFTQRPLFLTGHHIEPYSRPGAKRTTAALLGGLEGCSILIKQNRCLSSCREGTRSLCRKVRHVCFCRARGDILRWSMKCIRQRVVERVAAEVWVTCHARVMRWPTSPQIHLCAAALRVAVDSTLVDGPGGPRRAAEGRVCPRSPDDDPAETRRAQRMRHRGAFICSTSQTFSRKIRLLPGENIISCLLSCFASLR